MSEVGDIKINSIMFLKFVYYKLFILLIISSLLGCSQFSQLEGAGTTLYENSTVVLNKIAVLPFQQAAPEDVAGGAVHCPLCGSVFHVDKLSGRPEKIVENIFVEYLMRSKTLHLVPSEEVKSAYIRMVSDADKAIHPDIVGKIGQELGADAVVVGHLYRYRERIGYPYSVKQPASVTFHIHLVRVLDGAIIWTGNLNKTQKSLMENMLQLPFFYKEKGRWLTAEELTEEGIREIIKNFPVTGKYFR